MSPLPLDMPDDYPWLPSSARYPLADLGEQAVRLGSPVTFDRRGEVVWYDVCDRGLSPYFITGSGTGNLVRVNTLGSLHGGYVLQMHAGSDAGHLSQIEKHITKQGMLRAGLEVASWLPVGGERFVVTIQRTTGTREFTAKVGLNYANQTLELWTAACEWESIDDIGVFEDNYGVYHHLKLAVDFESGYFMRMLYDDRRYDLSNYGLRVTDDTTIAMYRAIIKFVGLSGQNNDAYVGHVILTGNEP